MKIFEAFGNSKELLEKTKYLKVYKCICDGKEYQTLVTRKFANKKTVIHCSDDTVFWEQLPLFPKLQSQGDRVSIYKFDGNKKFITIFVIKGSPRIIEGLDDGIFRGADNFDDCALNVMTYEDFKKM